MASLALVPMAMFARRDHRFEATCAGHRVTLLTMAPLSRRGLCFADLDATLARKRRYVHLISSHMGEGGSFKGRESGRGGREVHGKGGKEGGKASREGSPLEALGFRAACAALSPEARTPPPPPTPTPTPSLRTEPDTIHDVPYPPHQHLQSTDLTNVLTYQRALPYVLANLLTHTSPLVPPRCVPSCSPSRMRSPRRSWHGGGSRATPRSRIGRPISRDLARHRDRQAGLKTEIAPPAGEDHPYPYPYPYPHPYSYPYIQPLA